MKTIIPETKLTIEERLLKVEESRVNRALNLLLEAMTKSFDAVWENPAKTPAQMIAAQGTAARGNFQDHARTVVYLIQSGVAVPAKYQSAPRDYTVHDDGTVTLD
jgi:hypothetical protein